MVTHVTRGGITEFIRLAADTFSATPDAAERAVRRLLVQLVTADPSVGADGLLDHVPGARDVAFAELLARATRTADGDGPDTRGAAATAAVPSADLFALYLSYCSAHAGVDCASRLLAAAYRVGPLR